MENSCEFENHQPGFCDRLFDMSTAKSEFQQLLNTLPDDCSLEDIQYHLYVIEKGPQRA